MRYEKVNNGGGMVNAVGLSNDIKEARKRLNISRIAACAYCGVSELTFIRWEKGATKFIKEENYNKLVDILNGEYCA